jgi:hypothetical protein
VEGEHGEDLDHVAHAEGVVRHEKLEDSGEDEDEYENENRSK